jgi:hypothetical protein
MMSAFRALVVSLRLVSVFAGAATPLAHAAEVWLGPQASVPPSPLSRAVDMLEMFTPEAPWQQAAANVKVFKLYASFLGGAPQDQVDKIVADLNRRHIALGLEAGVMNIGPKSTNPPCGGLGLVEGYGIPAVARNISQKIKKAGGVISYLAMDEPLWYGHYYKGRPGAQPGCQSSIDEIVKLMAPTLGVYREEFPDIVVGEVEPTDVAEQSNWQADLSAWATQFRQSTGKPLAFLQFDVLWNRPNEDKIVVGFFRYAEAMERQALLGKIGIIYNGSPQDKSDEAWVRSAQDHILSIEVKNGLRPDQAVIQSWVPNPTHAMPDSSPAALTSLVLFYVQRRMQ